MPSAPDHLRAKFDGPEAAFEGLTDRYTWHNGIIRPKSLAHTMTSSERDAVDYLWLEWDFSYVHAVEPEPKSRIVATPVSSSLGEGTMWIPPGDTYVAEDGTRTPLTVPSNTNTPDGSNGR